MSRYPSLVFLGGITYSGKSLFLDKIDPDSMTELAGRNPKNIMGIRVFNYFKDIMDLPESFNTNALTLTNWKTHENEAVNKMVLDIKNWSTNNILETVIFNTHYATNSPSGFQLGLDIHSLRRIMESCHYYESDNKAKVAIILIDIDVSDILKRREYHWSSYKVHEPISHILKDLEFNRLYSYQYNTIISSIIGADRVIYKRIQLNLKNTSDLSDTELKKTSAFELAYNEFNELLNSEMTT